MAIDINIPSQVRTFANLAAFPATGALKTIYIAEDTNKTYRWTGSVYVEVSAAGATGITIGTTAITSGTVGRVLFQGTGNVVQESANLFWDDAANRLIVGGSTASNVRANINEFNVQANGLTVPTNGNQLMFNLVGSGQGMTITNQNGTTYRIGQYAASNVLTIGHTSNSTLNLFTSGNVGINTTTDAGFKLDVNGTARVKGTGATSATTAFTVQNSASATGLTVFDNGNVSVGSSSNSFYQLFGNGSWFNSGTIYTPILYTNYIEPAGGGSNRIYANANNIKIGTTATATATAIFEIDSTTKGFLCPRMTTTQKNAITSPATGLMVYDTTLNLISVYNGTTWISL